jgi:RecB family endonuclease NucS
MQLIRALNAADEGAQQEIFRLVAEWDVLEAIAVAQVVRGRIEVVRKFGTLIKAKAPEKPDMQDFVKEHPWLLDPKWDVLQHERSLDKVLAEHFATEGEGPTGKRRLDYFCLADSLLAVVVEVKRPGDLIGRDELAQIEDYVDYLRTWEAQSTDPDRRRIVRGSLIYSRMKADAKEKARRLMDDGIFVVTWEKLLADAERLHHEFLDLVKSRAPQEDPRIMGLDTLERDSGTHD